MTVFTNPGSQTLDMINTTVAGNHARTGLGAGLSINNNITGQIHHATIANNSNEGPTSFASAINGGAGVSITNSIIADNTKVTYELREGRDGRASAVDLQVTG